MLRIFIILFFVLFSIPAFSQIQSVLIDNQTSSPIPFATIQINDTDQGTHSSHNGVFRLECKNQTIIIRHVSYKTISIDCSSLSDTVKLEPSVSYLQAVEVTGKRDIVDFKRRDIEELGYHDERNRIHYSGIKEACVFIKNKLKRPVYIKEIHYRFNRVKLNEDGRVENRDILLSINLYERDPITSEPGEAILLSQQTYRLKSGARKLDIDLTHYPTLFPSSGAFVSVEFLGYYNEEGAFKPVSTDDLHVKEQFAPNLSNGHQYQYSYYRATYSDHWKRVGINIDGFANFNFGLEVITVM